MSPVRRDLAEVSPWGAPCPRNFELRLFDAAENEAVPALQTQCPERRFADIDGP